MLFCHIVLEIGECACLALDGATVARSFVISCQT